jgi:hypothetical protein
LLVVAVAVLARVQQTAVAVAVLVVSEHQQEHQAAEALLNQHLL